MANQGPRVLIVGGLGAGKTTLGRLLGEALGVPCHSLDGVAFVDDRWTMRALEDRLRMIDGIAEQPAWIAEGGHLFWTDRLMRGADLIIWLDLPLLALLRRRRRRPGRSLGWHLARLRWLLRWYLGLTGIAVMSRRLGAEPPRLASPPMHRNYANTARTLSRPKSSGSSSNGWKRAN
jgi:shikimate kinase